MSTHHLDLQITINCLAIKHVLYKQRTFQERYNYLKSIFSLQPTSYSHHHHIILQVLYHLSSIPQRVLTNWSVLTLVWSNITCTCCYCVVETRPSVH